MVIQTLSPLADKNLVKKLRTSITRKSVAVTFKSRRKVFGVVVHTTGSGVYKPALVEKHGSAFKVALAVYASPSMSVAHYVIDYETGKIAQVVDDGLIAPHCGIDGWQLQAMADGSWDDDRLSDAAHRLFRDYVSENAPLPRPPSKVALALWKARWQTPAGYYRAPRYIYPSKSPNADFCGIELIPAPPGYPHQIRYSDVQLNSLAHLVHDLQNRWDCRMRKIGESFPTPRLLGHEDLDPFDRWDSAGGWDPGALRHQPRFDWADLGLRLAKLGI